MIKRWVVSKSNFFLSTLAVLYNVPFEIVFRIEKKFFIGLEKIYKDISKN